jgi:two-component system response regulator YesN
MQKLKSHIKTSFWAQLPTGYYNNLSNSIVKVDKAIVLYVSPLSLWRHLYYRINCDKINVQTTFPMVRDVVVINILTVMIVEDEKIMREDLMTILDWDVEGYKLMPSAVNGKQGLDFFDHTRPQIVISDICMPVMDGLAMVKSIKDLAPHTRILILSAFGEFDYAKEAMRIGADDYILKTELSSTLLKQKLDSIRDNLEKSQTAAIGNVKGQLRELIDSPETADISSVLANCAEILSVCDVETISSLLIPYLEKSLLGSFEALSMTDRYTPYEGDPETRFQWLASQLKKLKLLREGSHHSPAVLNAIEYINQYYGNNALKTEDVARHAHLSKGRLGVVFKQETGQTINDYLTTVRMDAAKSLLLSGRYKVYEVAEKVGYQTSQYFSQIFYQNTGQHPNKYRTEG